MQEQPMEEVIKKLRDPANWTPHFFAEIEEQYFSHLSAIRNTLVRDGLWDKWDQAFSAWKYKKENAPVPKEKAVSQQKAEEKELIHPVQLVTMSEVEEKEPEWLINGYIPKGQITIIAGDGGTGKTFVWVDTVAAVSSGGRAFFEKIPEGSFGELMRAPANVLFFSSEDSIEITLKRRLRKAGADLSRIYSISLKDPRFTDIKFNAPILMALISEYKPALVIFDPLQAFIPSSVQMSQRNAMRQIMNPLIALGEKFGTTFLIVCHTNKRAGCYGRNRVSDSSDIWDVSRSVLICGHTNENGIRYLSHEKSNYGELNETALFSLRDEKVNLEGYTNKRDVDFVRQNDFTVRQKPQRDNAEKFIMDFLRDGERPTADLDKAAVASGISSATLSRAKTSLKKKDILVSRNVGYGKSKKYMSSLRQEQNGEFLGNGKKHKQGILHIVSSDDAPEK